MKPSNCGDGFSQAPEEERSDDEAYNSRDPASITPTKCLFDEYGHNAKCKSTEQYDLKRTYEKPYVNYYIVVTPYGNRKGMTMTAVKNLVKRRWKPERLIITYENTDDQGKRVNPHYNIIVTTRKELETSNSNNLNINVQPCFNNVQIVRAIEYSFKTYMPNNTCIKEKHFYAWKRNLN